MTTKSKNSYENLSAIEALNKANTNILLIPDIQRDYVWDVEDIESLFDSIVRNFPIGSFIFFKTTPQHIKECKLNLYSFFHEYRKTETRNQQVVQNIIDDMNRYIVIDGQQRLTSLNIGLYGFYEVYKGGRGKKKTNHEHWSKKELYYNMTYYENNGLDYEYELSDFQYNSLTSEDNRAYKRFIFLDPKNIAKSEKYNYVKVKDLLSKSGWEEFANEIKDKYQSHKNTLNRSLKDLEILYNRLHEKEDNALVHYYSVNENDYNKAVDIFIKINGSGKKLSKSDLIFSALVSYWPEGKEKVDSLLKSMNGLNTDGTRKFNFSRDYLILACLILLDKTATLKISELTYDIIQKIKDSWEKFEYVFNALVDILDEFKLNSKWMLSYNATIPVLYFIFKTAKYDNSSRSYSNLNLKISKLEIFKYLIISFAKNVFGASSPGTLDKIRTALYEKFSKEAHIWKLEFKLELFNDIEISGLRNFKVDQKEIERWIDTFKYNAQTFMLLTLLYSDLDKSLSFEQDHCHPQSFFKKNAENPKERFWDLLPNLQLLIGSENAEKGKLPLHQWVNTECENRSIHNVKFIDYKENPELLDIDNFKQFFEIRRKEMIKKLCKMFGINYQDELFKN